jgi:trimethylamine--corrinoid protein Co-methyltransferase
MLTGDVVHRVVSEAIEILSEIGCEVENATAREILSAHGTRMRNGRFLIPSHLVEKALAEAPREISLYDRDLELTAVLQGDRVHFDPGSAALKIYDSATRSIRPVQAADCFRFAALVDRLEHIALQSTGVVPEDVPAELADVFRLYVGLLKGRKPIVTGTFNKKSFQIMQELLTVVRGDVESLREKPLAIFDCCPTSPLKWSDLTCENLIDAARAGIPAEIVSMPLAGATAPVTLLGAITQHCAEILSGIVISQLVRPGAPVIYGGSTAIFDMQKSVAPLGAIETMMLQCANAQLAKYLKLPCHGYLGLSDAKLCDMQAGLESALGVSLAALAGINVVSGVGMLDFENCQSLEKLVIDNETCGMALRLIQGIKPRDVVFAKEILKESATSLDFLGLEHTLKWFREEVHYPGPVIDRAGDLEATGGVARSAFERAKDEVSRLLARPMDYPLNPDKVKELDAIMQWYFQHYGAELPSEML